MTIGLTGLAITGPLADSGLVAGDEQVPQDWAESRTPTLNDWTSWGSALSDTLTVVVIASLVGAVLLYLRRWSSALLLVTALAMELSIFMATTFAVERDRPDVRQLDVSPPTSSFPSGHTAAAVVLYVTLVLLLVWNSESRRLHTLGLVVALSAVPIVAFSRIYRGMHHPTDVVAGLVLGLGCVAIAYFAVSKWRDRTQHDESASQHEVTA
jgi:membrane-associated phospholipid phosphatase